MSQQPFAVARRPLLLAALLVLCVGCVSRPAGDGPDPEPEDRKQPAPIVELPKPPAPKKEEPPLYPVDARVEGKTYEEWTVAFFRWAFAADKARSPVLDKTGEFAAAGQSGPVWFLAGNLGGITRRKVTVPAGKPIFSPVLYGFPGAESSKEQMDRAADLAVTLDGKSLGEMTKQRVTTQPFDFVGPAVEDALHPAVAGKQRVAMNGYWIMLRPLPAGTYTLRIKARQGAENVEDEFELIITYELTVVEEKKT